MRTPLGPSLRPYLRCLITISNSWPDGVLSTSPSSIVSRPASSNVSTLVSWNRSTSPTAGEQGTRPCLAVGFSSEVRAGVNTRKSSPARKWRAMGRIESGASLERPGMDRVRDLVAGGGVAVILAQDRDRFVREPAYHYLLRREFEEHGTKLREGYGRTPRWPLE